MEKLDLRPRPPSFRQ